MKKTTDMIIPIPPHEIIEAAQRVSVWMDQNGHKNWQLGGICDRRFALGSHETPFCKK
jgi:hypothetical protein